MASTKEATQTIQPRNFNITHGNLPRHWRLATSSDPTAELLGADGLTWLEVTARTDINYVQGHRVKVSFVVSATQAFSGFNRADVRIGAKVGAEGNYRYQDIILDDLKVGEVTPFEVTFNHLDQGPSASDKAIHVTFDDTRTFTDKKGLKFYEARVTQYEPST